MRGLSKNGAKVLAMGLLLKASELSQIVRLFIENLKQRAKEEARLHEKD